MGYFIKKNYKKETVPQVLKRLIYFHQDLGGTDTYYDSEFIKTLALYPKFMTLCFQKKGDRMN